jgi:hypothetical protein
MDPAWGHLVVKMSRHPLFGAPVILNGHEYVACQAQAAGIGFTKEGNCGRGYGGDRLRAKGRAHGSERVSHTTSAPPSSAGET